jgi:hypothetical protein
LLPSNQLLRKLTGGDRRSIGRSEEVVALVLRQPASFTELIRGLRSEDPLLRMRAADAAEKASLRQPDLLKPFKAGLLRLLHETEQQELRWHLAQMVPRLPLSRRERARAVGDFRHYLQDRSSIVKTFAMQALVDMACMDKSLLPEIKILLQDSFGNGTAAMKARGRKLLRQLEASKSKVASSKLKTQVKKRQSKSKSL